MERFRLKPIEVEALQWTGDNAGTVTTNFGHLVSEFEDLGGGNFNLHTYDGSSLFIKLQDWMYEDLGGKLRVVDKQVFYKTHDYVSG
jgi:hypothetical protein